MASHSAVALWEDKKKGLQERERDRAEIGRWKRVL